MMWEQTTLGEICDNIQTGPFGSQLHQSDYSENGIPVVMPKDLLNGNISEASIARVGQDHVDRLDRHKISAGDILYSRRGDVGRCAYATERETGWLCGTGCLRVTTNANKANSRFVFYQLQMPEIVGWVEKHAVGATMLNLNTSILSAVPLRIPSIDQQCRIVEILSAYDNLLENNRKQITLLEEAAQRLYKEWFIYFRFPDWENISKIDGVPAGWKMGKIADIVEFQRGKTITKVQIQQGSVPVVAGGLEPAYFHNKANTGAPVITVSASGANAGFSRLYYTPVFASDCSFVDIKMTPHLFYIYCFLKDNQPRLNGLQKGSAQPHVYAKDINSMPILVPKEKILVQFDEMITPLFEKMRVLDSQIVYARQERDRLLPKLMSGEIEV